MKALSNKEDNKILAAMKLLGLRIIEDKRKHNLPIVTLVDNEVRLVDPFELDLPSDGEERA